MKKAVGALAALLVVGVPAAVLTLKGTSVPINEVRAARIHGDCPELAEGEENTDCPAGMFQMKDFCLCLTNKESVTDELTTPPVPNRMVVCSVTDEETGKKHLQVRTESAGQPLGNGCVLVASGILLPNVSMHFVESGIETQLRARCSPCVIAPDSWGPCPFCLHPDYGKTCAEVCP